MEIVGEYSLEKNCLLFMNEAVGGVLGCKMCMTGFSMKSVGVCSLTVVPGESAPPVDVTDNTGDGSSGILRWLLTEMKIILIFYVVAF